MGLGNDKYDNGGKGSNYHYQRSVLELLGMILSASGGGGGGSGATETTLLNVLAAENQAVINLANIENILLNAGSATSSNQVIGNNLLTSIDGKTPTLGQKTMANSSPIVIASNQTPIPITRTLSAATTGTITTTSSTVTVTNLNDTGAVTVSVYGTYTGVNFTFEAFDGTNWMIIPAQRVDDGSVSTSSGVIASIIRSWNVSPLLGFVQFRIRTTAWTSGTANIILQPSSQFIPIQMMLSTGFNTIGNIGVISGSVTPGNGAAFLGKAEDAVAASGDTGIFILGVRRDALLTSSSATADYNELAVNRFGAQYVAGFRTAARTYSATAQLSPIASATDICGIFGNATTTVQVTKIRITGVQTTTGSIDFALIKRSTANTGSTPVNFSVAAHDSTDAANSTTPVTYTATNPTTGTGVGTIRRWFQPIGTQASGIQGEYTLEFGENGKPLILSGIAQGLVLNLNGVTVAGGLINVSIEWIEF